MVCGAALGPLQECVTQMAGGQTPPQGTKPGPLRIYIYAPWSVMYTLSAYALCNDFNGQLSSSQVEDNTTSL